MTQDDDKTERRAVARAKRGKLNHDAGDAAPETLARHFRDAIPMGETSVVAGYWPVGSEFDVRPLLAAIAERGIVCALPVVEETNAPLRFRAWHPADATCDGTFGVQEPLPDRPYLTPTVLIVPLLAFDDDGYRLGYGGGYYDRTLAELRKGRKAVLAVGVGFAGQRMHPLPRDPHDQRLDWLITEQGARKCGG